MVGPFKKTPVKTKGFSRRQSSDNRRETSPAQDIREWDPFGESGSRPRSLSGRTNPPDSYAELEPQYAPQSSTAYEQQMSRSPRSRSEFMAVPPGDQPIPAWDPFEDEAIEDDPANDPSISKMRKQHEGASRVLSRRGETGPNYARAFKGSTKRVQHEFKRTDHDDKIKRNIAELENRGYVRRPGYGLTYFPKVSPQPIDPMQRRVLYPQRVSPDMGVDLSQQQRTIDRNLQRRQWKGMQHRKVFQKSQYKVHEDNLNRAKQMISDRRYLVYQGHTKAPKYDQKIRPTVAGLPTEGLVSISEEAEEGYAGQYFPQTFYGFHSRLPNNRGMHSDYTPSIASTSRESDPRSRPILGRHYFDDQTDDDTDWEQ